jgi:hypothetical protein
VLVFILHQLGHISLQRSWSLFDSQFFEFHLSISFILVVQFSVVNYFIQESEWSVLTLTTETGFDLAPLDTGFESFLEFRLANGFGVAPVVDLSHLVLNKQLRL